ncbi:MAG: hypothetical protein N2746_11670 [Deltaproteobacteria bacterium]|nr:hypothetical protein [Deltaproteobacteria bacterium]
MGDSKYKILFVDDEEENLSLYKDSLRDGIYDIFFAREISMPLTWLSV